jgi:hypothetical protein
MSGHQALPSNEGRSKNINYMGDQEVGPQGAVFGVRHLVRSGFMPVPDDAAISTFPC